MKFEKSTVLNNVNIKVVSGELVGVVGVARSDKSTLLQGILKEVEPSAKKRIGRDHPSSEHCSGS
jgi:ABC-type transporter Mla maintaining outer membrane lipid asymmetry ATPase subunit MlaF